MEQNDDYNNIPLSKVERTTSTNSVIGLERTQLLTNFDVREAIEESSIPGRHCDLLKRIRVLEKGRLSEINNQNK